MVYCIDRGATHVYDPVTNSWSAKSGMQFSFSGYSILQANVVDGKIFVLCGVDLFMYDPIADSWTNKTSIPGKLVTAVDSFVVDNTLMAVGRFQDTDTYSYAAQSPKVLTYDSITDSWSVKPTSESLSGTGVVGVTSGVYAPQRVYFFSTYAMGVFPTITKIYDPVANTWSVGEGVPTSRMNAGLVVIDDVFYVMGGSNGEVLFVNEQYIPVGYTGTLSSNDGDSFLNRTVVVGVVVLILIVVLVTVALYYRKKSRNKHLHSNMS